MRNRDHLEEFALDELEQVSGGCKGRGGGNRQFFGGDSTYLNCNCGGGGNQQSSIMETLFLFKLLGDDKGSRRRR